MDDESTVRFLLRWLLEREGHEVFEASDGAMALKQLATCGAELLVTDVTLPVMSGRELIERLRANPVTASIPIVVVSGQGEAASLPVEAVITKPFLSTDVLSAVRDVAERAG